MNVAHVSAAVSGAAVDGASVLALVDEQVRRRPLAAAVAAVDGGIDYATLSARADRCAKALHGQGIRAGEPVAVQVAPSAAGIGALLGVWRAGGVLVPLDPSQPPLRQREIIDIAKVRLVVGEGEGTQPYTVMDTGNARRTLDSVPDAAYIIHTSGSTGAPKGVVCTHAALANVARAQRTVFGLAPGDRVAQLAPWCVDAFLFEIALALGAGACVQVATPDDRHPGPPLERFLTRTRSTAAVITPSGLRALQPDQVPGLRLLISAGEALPPGLAREWTTGRRLVNAYGVTEGTIWTSYAELDEEALRHGESVPLGRPIPGCSLTVLDHSLQPVPPGTPGEACLGGAGLAVGYLDQDELTAERFPVVSSGRVFRTGDLVVQEGPDTLRFLGRDDDQVKLGGIRVELGEVRHRLTEHPAVHDCAVRKDGARLVAYVVPRGDDAAPDRRSLTAWLEERLPLQMVPSLYVPLAALPLTSWGKLDVGALPAPSDAVATQQDRVRSPRSATESYLTGVAAELLDVATVSPCDDLFLIGMTSLTMARLLRRVAEDLGVDIDPIDVFENPTAAELATVLDKRCVESA